MNTLIAHLHVVHEMAARDSVSDDDEGGDGQYAEDMENDDWTHYAGIYI